MQQAVDNSSKFNRLNIFENFLSSDLQVEVLKVLREPGWSLGYAPAIAGENRPQETLWHMNGLERNPLFGETIFRRVCKLFQTDFQVKRIYANGQLACQKGRIHRDDGDLTFVYFPLQEWLPEWGGSLMFYQNGEVMNCVSYKPNRALSFPAKVPHGAEAPSKDYQGMRVSIGFKLYLP